ncbi:MAG: glycoside hydrolase family 9 protein [Gammaproteobacteria bacterium]|nr:glycoside hydrolase [Gammaproteobacteria bacterium]
MGFNARNALRPFARCAQVTLSAALLALASSGATAEGLKLNEREYFSKRGLDVLVFSNWYDGNFSDSKIAGIELIHHGVRTATNGDVRLSPTPEQWDPVPELKQRRVLPEQGIIEARLAYPKHNFEYTIRAEPSDDGITLRVVLDEPLPKELEGKAGFNLEFLPSAYFGKTYLMDEKAGIFPLYPTGPTGRSAAGEIERLPFATGRRLVLAPEDPSRRVSIETRAGELGLFDGRNQAQNGWFVVRTLIPAGVTGTAVEWKLSANTLPNWTRPAVIAHSQVGYHPDQVKTAIIEMDRNADAPGTVRLLKVAADGTTQEVAAGEAQRWGEYLRYEYYTFDFTDVREPGLYVIEAVGQRTNAFRIARDVYDDTWHATLDVFFPVQMDHMFVNEAYRVWHGASHLDDARQAPPNHEHFDLYAMGPETDSPFAPGEHIPGLNVGGWYDAGDFDLRTQTQYAVVSDLVQVWEQFRPLRDETTVDQRRRHVELHQPDGIPDILQQIEHGTLFLIAQHRVFGHAIPGIVEPDLGQYTHLGDAVTKTDGKVHDPNDPNSPPDDRWAFTTATTALNYGSAAALAAASRALRGYNDELAEECLATAKRVWEFESKREPNLYRYGNTTGGHPKDEELRAAVELLITTGDKQYAKRIAALWSAIDERFMWNAVPAVRALPHMDKAFAAKLRKRAARFLNESKGMLTENPFGVPITRGGWAGNGAVIGFGLTNYYLHKAFPDLFTKDATIRALDYLYGTHPDSNISFVSAVGAHSKRVAYGNNRADFSFIAGGIVPGVLILKPDFPENKEDWPFLWGQNEYVVNIGASYILLVHAARELLEG